MELLSSTDLNHIIAAVDYNTSLFKKCELFNPGTVNEAQLIGLDTEYMKRTSASLTELVKTTLYIPADADRPVTMPNAFLKIWFAWNEVVLPVDEKIKIIDDVYAAMPAETFDIFGDKREFIRDITKDESSTSLDHESNIYKFITDNIIRLDASPNFIPLLTRVECSIEDVIKSLDANVQFTKNKKKLVTKLKLLHFLFPTLKLKFIMTGSAPNTKSAFDFFTGIKNRTNVLSESEYASIVFQFFHAHYIMSIFGIVHNDNHMGNVLIQTLSTPVTLDITIGTSHVQFTTNYIVKFFDWDRAYYTMGPENPITNSMLIYRNVKKFTPGRDFSAFICFLSDMNITGFDIILDRLIVGPKPTSLSNRLPFIAPIPDSKLIPGAISIQKAVTPELLKWLTDNPESITRTSGSYAYYITIPKTQFETFVKPNVISLMRSKFGSDRRTRLKIYDTITNIYFGVHGFDLIIYQGHSCNPMYDSNNLQVEPYFIDETKFATLCFGLDKNVVANTYRYSLLFPEKVSQLVNNIRYANQIVDAYTTAASKSADDIAKETEKAANAVALKAKARAVIEARAAAYTAAKAALGQPTAKRAAPRVAAAGMRFF